MSGVRKKGPDGKWPPGGRRVALTVALPPGMVAARIAAARPDLSRRIDGIMFQSLQRTVDRVRAQWPISKGPTGGRSSLAWGVIRLREHTFQIRNDAREGGGFYAGFVFRGDPAKGADNVPGVRHVIIADDAKNRGGLLFEVRRAYLEINRDVVALVETQPARIGVPERRVPEAIVHETEPVDGRQTTIVSNEVRESVIDVTHQFDFTTPRREEPRALSFFELVVRRLKQRLMTRLRNAVKARLGRALALTIRRAR